MGLDNLRDDIIIKQKKGLPFIMTSVVIWTLVTIVSLLDIEIGTKNLLVFCCSSPLVPLSWLIGKKLKIDIFSNENELGKLGSIFTMNQLLYLLIVVWVFNAVPEKMIMVHAMVFGAHLLPYSWLYKSNSYRNCAIIIPILSLVLGTIFNGSVVAGVLIVIEIIFVLSLLRELKQISAI